MGKLSKTNTEMKTISKLINKSNTRQVGIMAILVVEFSREGYKI
jgi:hypothetical protein